VRFVTVRSGRIAHLILMYAQDIRLAAATCGDRCGGLPLRHFFFVRPGDIGNTLYRRDRLHIRSERVVDGLQGSLLEVNVSEVIVHEGDEPDSVIDLLDSDPLTGEHG
jgi:hypothetical protein